MMEVRQIPSSDRGLFSTVSRVFRVLRMLFASSGSAFLRNLRTLEEPLEVPKAPQSDPGIAVGSIYIYV